MQVAEAAESPAPAQREGNDREIFPKGQISCTDRDTAYSGWHFLQAIFSMENLVNKPPGTNVLHVHFEAGAPNKWNV
jgi:hypothetical protein